MRSASRVLFAVALLVPVAAALAKGEIPVSDAALFEYYGRAMLRGNRLYLDLWDNKLPSIYALNAGLQALFGGRYLVHTLVEAAVTACSTGLFAFVLIRNEIRSWAPAALAFALFASIPPPSFDSVENFALFLILLAYALWFSRRTVPAGVALALAATFWLPALLMVIPLLDRERERRRQIALIAGTACTLAVYAVLMVAVFGAPAIAELMRSWVAYGANSFGGRARAGGRLGIFAPVLNGLITSGAGFLVALVAAVAAKPRDPVRRFALVWTLCALAGAVALGNFYAHYFIPALAPCIFAIAAFAGERRATFRGVLFGALALFFAVRLIGSDARAIPQARTGAHTKRIVGELVRAVGGDHAVIDVDPYEPAVFLAADADGEDRFGLVPPNVRPPQRPNRAAPAALARLDAEALAPPEAGARACAHFAGWTIFVPRGARPDVVARCRALAHART